MMRSVTQSTTLSRPIPRGRPAPGCGMLCRNRAPRASLSLIERKPSRIRGCQGLEAAAGSRAGSGGRKCSVLGGWGERRPGAWVDGAGTLGLGSGLASLKLSLGRGRDR